MTNKDIFLALHPPSLTRGKIKVELDPLPAAVLKCLLEVDSKKPVSNEVLATYLNPLGFQLPSFIQMQEVLKNLRQAMQVVGVDNPVLNMAGGLLLNLNVKVNLTENEQEPDLLDAIYNDLMSN